MFSCKVCKTFKNIFFTEHLLATASEFIKIVFKTLLLLLLLQIWVIMQNERTLKAPSVVCFRRYLTIGFSMFLLLYFHSISRIYKKSDFQFFMMLSVYTLMNTLQINFIPSIEIF